MQDVETCEVRTRAMCYRRTPVNVGKAPLKGEEEAHRKERRTYIGVSREPCRCASKDKVPRAKGRIATGEPGRPSSGNTTHLERKKKRQRKVPAHTSRQVHRGFSLAPAPASADSSAAPVVLMGAAQSRPRACTSIAVANRLRCACQTNIGER